MEKRVLIEEKDACAIIAFINKNGKDSHANIVKTIEALKKMGHRSGDIDGEGDGTGIMIDLPRKIWQKKLIKANKQHDITAHQNFIVGHIFILHNGKNQINNILERCKNILANFDIKIIHETTDNFRHNELGPRGLAEAPTFWQFCAILSSNINNIEKTLFNAKIQLEQNVKDIHIASLSNTVAVYKIRGGPEIISKVFPDLEDSDVTSAITLGHTRYSTNTLPTIERAQPFSHIGHNGEINTIERVRTNAEMMGIRMVPGGSDSQDLDRVIEGLIHLYNLHPLEAVEIVFPTIISETQYYEPALRDLYTFFRWFFPSSAQGPAAIIGRFGDVCIGSVDALGLRPLWFGESDYDYFLSSEKGVVTLLENMTDPKPLAPGEKIAIFAGHNKRARVLFYDDLQYEILRISQEKNKNFHVLANLKNANEITLEEHKNITFNSHPVKNTLLRAFGWLKFDYDLLKRMTIEGKDIVGSMGHQGPLANLMLDALPNLSDFFKENVAVVTNPSIDRERETEHFSTHVILGDKPEYSDNSSSPKGLWLNNPFLLGGYPLTPELKEIHRKVAKEFNTATIEDVYHYFSDNGCNNNRVKIIDATFDVNANLQDRLKEIQDDVIAAVKNGTNLIIINDDSSFTRNNSIIDPYLLTAYLNNALIDNLLRRKCSIIVRSGAIRNLHDAMFALGMGADAVNPYVMWQLAISFSGDELTKEDALRNIINVLQQGVEKIMSTMGIHELCGYGRIFGSIGLKKELEDIFKAPNFCSSEKIGFGFKEIQDLAIKRLEWATRDEDVSLYAEEKRNPKVGRIIRDLAKKKIDLDEFTRRISKLEEEEPIAIRHLISITEDIDLTKIRPEDVDITIGDHDMPIVIAAMSFGSQGENSFRTYAEAAKRANIVCLNGEGGEIPDMLFKYNKNRGQQVASGRFGVYIGLLNSGDFIEIKIGQGAKPGEGGHLPGAKVSEMVAKARHCKPGIPLISPSNQHDIYSIEDLAQIITELKTANPHAKISVKIPVTMGCGTIAVGIAKAGADIINLSGYEGGTGAAREHAKKFVGFPVEIGVTQAHKALVQAGIRDKVEIWCDGGIRSPLEIVKMILLGADRVGLGTVALMAIGCISCERCHLDRCPRGISTQLRTKEDAESKGVKGFTPRTVEEETEALTHLFRSYETAIKRILADMGQNNIRKIVGRTDLLKQTKFKDIIDLSEILERATCYWNCLKTDEPNRIKVRKPLNLMTKVISDVTIQRFKSGETIVDYIDSGIQSNERTVGTYLSGEILRNFGMHSVYKVNLFLENSVPGNGLCAFNLPNIDAIIEGGAQDGFAKGSIGGLTAVVKGTNYLGKRIDGSVGKSFAYGAIRGTLIVQNYADSRACIRMSGADVVFGARIKEPVKDERGNIGCRSHLKGFAFEYMTGGRAVVLCDPGPWMCAGMTGGVIYQCLYPEYNFTKNSVKRRLAKGANVTISNVDEKGIEDIKELLNKYIEVLERTHQYEEIEFVRDLLNHIPERFIMIEPKGLWQIKAA